MQMPTVPQRAAARVTVGTFPGLDRRAQAPEGCFSACENLSTRAYPLAASREARRDILSVPQPGGLIGKETLGCVLGGSFYYGGEETPIHGLSAGEKQLVSMGAYVLIFPDKRYYNTADSSDFGDMEARFSYTGTAVYTPCTAEGEPIEPLTGGSAPAEAEEGAYFLDLSEGKLYRYSATAASWAVCQSVYTRVDFTTLGSLPQLFRRGDGIAVKGCGALDGCKQILAMGGGESEHDFLVLTGLRAGETDEHAAISLSRTLPQMDFVCQCANRLWGCFYGRGADGETRNELYCSALGDFRNWNRFEGISTDSWVASVGSDGPWTGCVNYLGSPLFFKADALHRIGVSPQGAHSVRELRCRGVQKGSAKSLAVVGETLYYKSEHDVCAYQGGFPESVGAPLGPQHYAHAVGGAWGGRYVLSMEGPSGWELFTYDTALGLWMKEDELQVLDFAATEQGFFVLCADGRIQCWGGSLGTEEDAFPWSFTTQLLHYGLSEEKYLSRLCLRLSLQQGATARAEIEYDSSGEWERAGQITGSGLTRSFVLPIRPRRCDHMRLRLSGWGEMRLYSLSRILERGSDVPSAEGGWEP